MLPVAAGAAGDGGAAADWAAHRRERERGEMAASRTRGAVVVLVGVAFALGGGLAGRSPAFARREPHPGTPPGQQQDEELYGCDRTFGRPPEGHLQKRTEPAGDHDLPPGDTIRATLTWQPRDWSSD